MDEKDKKIIEHAIWALLLAWFSYMFFYQNLLLYRWHRGLPLPSRWPFVLLGVAVGTLFFAYKLRDIENADLDTTSADAALPKEGTCQHKDSL